MKIVKGGVEMKLKLMCVKYHVTLSHIAELTGVSRQSVSERVNDKNNRYWNEPQMKVIWDYFRTLDNNIKITDLFF